MEAIEPWILDNRLYILKEPLRKLVRYVSDTNLFIFNSSNKLQAEHSLAHSKNRRLEVPILNHSRFININNKIAKLIIEIVIAIGLDITILL